MRHIPRGAPKIGNDDVVERALAAEGLDVDADGFEFADTAGDAEAKRIGAAGLRGATLRERADGAEPVVHERDGGGRRGGFAAEGVAPPVEFEAGKVVGFDDFLDLREHEGTHLGFFVIKAGAIVRQAHRRRIGAVVEAHRGLREERGVEEAAGVVEVAVHIVHADADPRGNAAPAASGGGLGEPIDTGVEEILVEIHERHDRIDILLDGGGLGGAGANGVAAEELTIAAAVTVEDARDGFARIPRAGGVGVDNEGIDAVVGEQVDVAVDGLGGERPTLGLPFFRVVEIDAGIAVEEVAVAGEERIAGRRCHSDRGRRG